MKVFSNKILFLRIIKNIPQIMDIQRHSSVLGDTVEKLSDEASYKQLFHAYRDEEALPSGEVLKEIIDLCRAILFPGYYGNARIRLFILYYPSRFMRDFVSRIHLA